MGNKYERFFRTYKRHGSFLPKGFERPSLAKAALMHLWDLLLHTVARRFTLTRLDKVLTEKIGKAPSKSQIVRERAKSFNDGYQKAMADLKKRGYWLPEEM